MEERKISAIIWVEFRDPFCQSNFTWVEKALRRFYARFAWINTNFHNNNMYIQEYFSFHSSLCFIPFGTLIYVTTEMKFLINFFRDFTSIYQATIFLPLFLHPILKLSSFHISFHLLPMKPFLPYYSIGAISRLHSNVHKTRF